MAMKTKKGVVEMTVDEHPRPDVTAAGMAKLPPVFKKNGTVTAANASGFKSWFLFHVFVFDGGGGVELGVLIH